MNKTRVALLCMLAASAYGVLHDQVTVRVCLEYFTIAHPPLFPTTSPTLLALCWGVTATLGVGAALGVVLALVSQSGGQAPCPIDRLGLAILLLLGVTALSACAAGVAGYLLSAHGIISLPLGFAEAIPAPQHHRFLAVWFAHGAAYLAGIVGGGRLCLRLWRERGRPRVLSVFPRTWAGVIRTVIVAAVAAVILWIRSGSR